MTDTAFGLFFSSMRIRENKYCFFFYLGLLHIKEISISFLVYSDLTDFQFNIILQLLDIYT